MTAGQPNVLLLTVDALRADHLSCHGYERETTPALDRLAGKNAFFETAISPSSHTREALPALLTGTGPTAAVDDGYRLATETIAGPLSRAGYATAGFHSNPYVSRAYGYGSAFDVFDDDLYLGRHRFVALAQRLIDKLRNRHYATAETINERSLAWIHDADEPFFCWNHYMDPHGPYAPPASYQEAFHGARIGDRTAQRRYRDAIDAPAAVSEDEHAELVDLYDGEVKYTDDAIDALLEALADRGLLEETLVVVTADHGDGFGEHGYYGHPRQLHDELLHVPLLVAGPEVPETTVTGPVSTLDVVPTILAATGLDPGNREGRPLTRAWSEEGSHQGVAYASVRGEDEDRPLRRFAARTGNWKVVLTRHVETGECVNTSVYDLQTDPGEREPIEPVALDEASSATDVLEAVRARSAAEVEGAPVADRDKSVDSAVADRLEILGYK